MITAIRLLCLLAFLLPLASQPMHAQDPPMKWGKIPQEHLEMSEFPADTNAAAVILADYGTVQFERDYSLSFRRHRRIKILSEAGFEWGTFSVAYLAEGRAEKVRGVRGQTFVLDENGKVRRHKLSRRDVFDEDVDGRLKRVRFTLPALEVGAVIEYRYQLEADNPYYMPGWTFQSSEPTLWSEFRPEIPERLHYVRASRGVVTGFDVEESREALRREGTSMIHRFVLKDVPALREEPYMTTPNDYRAAIELQLSGYVEPGFGLRRILHTWDETASELRDIALFKQIFDPPRAVREQAAVLTEGLDSPAAKMRAVYDDVRSTVSWDGRRRVIPDQKASDVLTSKKGTSADVAALLGSMLRAAGLPADPVLISTRSHGAVIEIYPLVNQFNQLIMHVREGGRSHFLDATDPLRPSDLLAMEDLSGRGWMVTEDGQEWVSVSSSGRFEHDMRIDATILESGDVRAFVRTHDGGYSALAGRTKLKDSDDDEYVRKTLLEGRETSEIGAFAIDGRDPNESALSASGEVVFPAYAQVAGDMIYFNPKILDRIDENPFRLPERTFPVDYGYPSTRTYTVQFVAPEGYEVQELPSSVRLQLSRGGALYQRSVAQEDSLYSIRTKLEISRPIFERHQYGELRELYERAVALDGEQVVFKRKEAEVPQTQ